MSLSSKCIHRLWLGPAPMPDDQIIFGEKWKLLNPDWVVIEWDQHSIDLERLRNKDVALDIYNRGGQTVEAAVQLADVIGYELIWEYGGIYVNTDIEPVRSMEYLYKHYGVGDNAYAAREDRYRIVNAVLGGPPKHEFWNSIIDKLPDRYFKDPTAEMVETTGPALLTDTVYSWGREGFSVLPIDSFNSVHWSDIPAGSDAVGRWSDSPNIIGVHHWNHRKTGRSNLVGV